MSDKLYSPIIYDPISKIYYKQELNTHVGIVLNAQQQFVNKLIKQRDQYKEELHRYKAENEKLKEEVEHLNGIIKDEEDWKLLELEERWEW